MLSRMAASDLVAPIFLVATPQVEDPFFRRSVVLLLAHEEAGSFGFIVNRRTELTVAEILGDLSIEWAGDPGARAGFGGPVQPQVGTVLFSAEGEELPELPGSSEVLPGVRVSQHRSELAQLAVRPPRRLRLLLGYAGWDGGQLVSEIVRNDWILAPVDPELLFGEDVEGAWERGLRSAGIDPGTLVASALQDGGESPN